MWAPSLAPHLATSIFMMSCRTGPGQLAPGRTVRSAIGCRSQPTCEASPSALTGHPYGNQGRLDPGSRVNAAALQAHRRRRHPRRRRHSCRHQQPFPALAVWHTAQKQPRPCKLRGSGPHPLEMLWQTTAQSRASKSQPSCITTSPVPTFLAFSTLTTSTFTSFEHVPLFNLQLTFHFKVVDINLIARSQARLRIK